MRRRVSLMLTATLVVVVAAVVPAGAGNSAVPVPFKATLGGDQVMFDFAADFEARCSEIDPAEVDWVTTFEGSGRATHLGVVNVWAQHCTDIDTGRYGDGMIILTAANGDTLVGTYGDGITMPADPTDPAPTLFAFFDAFQFSDGGGGRFAAAGGSGMGAGFFDAATNEWSTEMRGTIVYGR